MNVAIMLKTRCFLSIQVHGIVQDRNGKTAATLFGKWDESMHYVHGDCSEKGKGFESLSEARLLWKRSRPPQFPTRYNLTRFAMTLNELTPGLKVMVSYLQFSLVKHRSRFLDSHCISFLIK